jgi:hypothetical protein
MARLTLGLALLCSLLGQRIAMAQSAGNMQLDSYAPAMDARGYLTLNGTSVLGPYEASFGLGSIEWGHGLLEFQNGSASYQISNMVDSTLVGALGLNVLGVPFELGMSLPLEIMDGNGHELSA